VKLLAARGGVIARGATGEQVVQRTGACLELRRFVFGAVTAPSPEMGDIGAAARCSGSGPVGTRTPLAA